MGFQLKFLVISVLFTVEIFFIVPLYADDAVVFLKVKGKEVQPYIKENSNLSRSFNEVYYRGQLKSDANKLFNNRTVFVKLIDASTFTEFKQENTLTLVKKLNAGYYIFKFEECNEYLSCVNLLNNDNRVEKALPNWSGKSRKPL